MHAPKVELALLSDWPDFVVALPAIYRSALSGLKRYFGVFATLGTDCGEHLALRLLGVATVSVTSVALAFFSFLSTGGTAFGLVSIAFGLEEILLCSTEGELSSAIAALEGLVIETHCMTSSFYLVRVTGHPTLKQIWGS